MITYIFLHTFPQDPTAKLNMAEEEVDYMSISFLQDTEAENNKKKKQRLNPTVATSKQQRKKQRRFSQQEHMDTNLQQGLNKPIESTNKGFKLLEKFGFKKDDGGLGKFGTGIVEPITVRTQLGKQTTLGIGKERSLLQVKTRFKEQLVKHQESMASLESHFRHSLKYVQKCKELRRDVFQSEKVIEQLDTREGIERHDLWPCLEVEDIDQCTDDEDRTHGSAGTDREVAEVVVSAREGDDFPRLLQDLELRLTVRG